MYSKKMFLPFHRMEKGFLFYVMFPEVRNPHTQYRGIDAFRRKIENGKRIK